MSNGLVGLWLKPVVCRDDDFGAVSDWKASRMDDTAPRAGNIARTPTMPHDAAFTFAKDQQTPCHREKPNKTTVFLYLEWPLCPGN